MQHSRPGSPRRSFFLAYFFESRSFLYSEGRINSIKKIFFLFKLIITSMIDKYIYRHYDYFICGSDVLLSLVVAAKLASNGKTVLLAPVTLTSFSSGIGSLVDLRQSIFTEKIDELISNHFGLHHSHDGLNSIIGDLISRITIFNNDNDSGSVDILDSDCFYIPSGEIAFMYGFRQILPGRMVVYEKSSRWETVRRLLPSVGIGKNSTNDTLVSVENVIQTSRGIRIDGDGLYKGVNYNLGDSGTNTETFQYLGEEERISDILSAIYFTN